MQNSLHQPFCQLSSATGHWTGYSLRDIHPSPESRGPSLVSINAVVYAVSELPSTDIYVKDQTPWSSPTWLRAESGFVRLLLTVEQSGHVHHAKRKPQPFTQRAAASLQEPNAAKKQRYILHWSMNTSVTRSSVLARGQTGLRGCLEHTGMQDKSFPWVLPRQSIRLRNVLLCFELPTSYTGQHDCRVNLT